MEELTGFEVTGIITITSDERAHPGKAEYDKVAKL